MSAIDDRAAIFSNLMLCIEQLTLPELIQLEEYLAFVLDWRWHEAMVRQAHQARPAAARQYINLDMVHYGQPIVIGGVE